MTTLAPELTWTGDGFEPGVRVELRGERIVALHRGPADAGADPTPRSMPRRALLPGWVNAHSHAFQRGLRGHGQRFPAGAGSFWTWRQAMYGLVERLDEAALRALCLRAFREMRAAGVTAVGEFHYLHHLDAAFAADAVVLDAARRAGLRVVLLQACYERAGFIRGTAAGGGLADGARRFDTARPPGDPGGAGGGLDRYWRQLDVLLEHTADDPRATVGVVAHSLRAVPIQTVVALHRGARARGLVFHLHLEEQRREIDDCRAAHGVTPMRLLLDHLGGELGPETTAVHCTHSDPAELAELLATGAHLCLCPTTEADLGDGLAPLAAVARSLVADGDARPGALCLGTDSNQRISMLEEMRWAEHGQRLRTEGRGVLRDAAGRVGRPLLRAASAAGARSLGLDAGAVAAGRLADFTVVDLDHPSLAGCAADGLEDALVFGCAEAVVDHVWVGGEALEPDALESPPRQPAGG